MARGFVTIATGQERYYEIARNLLRSYRQFASKNIHLPLFVIASMCIPKSLIKLS